MPSADARRRASSSSIAARRSAVSPTSSVGQANKEKPVVQRTKSGCWSCRIRRKKCHGRSVSKPEVCIDCARLGLDCLGWGEKRPDHLKTESVGTLKIRHGFTDSLRSRDLIRGQPKSSDASTTQKAMEESDSATSIDEDEEDQDLVLNFPGQPTLVQNALQPILPPLSPSSLPILLEDLCYAYDGTDYPEIQDSEDCASSDDWAALTHPTDPLYPLHAAQASDIWVSPSDELQITEFSISTPEVLTLPLVHDLDVPILQNKVHNYWFMHYVDNVLPLQYLMEDTFHMRQVMVDLARKSDPLAMLALSAAHYVQSDGFGPVPYLEFLHSAVASLDARLNKEKAMAALHLVSVSLFRGCDVSWESFLDYARAWYQQEVSRYGDPSEFMRNLWAADPLTKFVSKTTMWMDIFGAISSQTVPRFIEWYKVWFQPAWGGLVGMDNGFSRDDTIKMHKTMGAENDVMLAFASIAELDAWKAAHLDSLSMPELVNRGRLISRELLTTRDLCSPPTLGTSVPSDTRSRSTPSIQSTASCKEFTPYGSSYSEYEPPNGHVDQDAEVKRVMSAVFRASARVYLEAVLSGYKPQVPEIRAAVLETIDCLKALTGTDAPYDRSLVLPLFIAGVVTDDPEQQAYIHSRLSAIRNIKVGNCGQVRHLLEAVWWKRATFGGEICWRATMKELNLTLLFV